MKILLVSPEFFPFIGGAENLVLRICSQLKKLNHKPIVFTSTKNAKNLNGIKIYSFPPLFKYSNTPFNFWGSGLKKIIEKEKPEIIVGSHSTPFMADFAARIAKKNNIPFFLIYHNDYIKQNFFEKTFLGLYNFFVLKKTFGLTEKIIATSDCYAEKSFFLNEFKAKLAVVPPFLDLTEFKVQEEYKKTFPKNKVVLFVGALNKGQKYKGLDYLIKSVSMLKKDFPEIKLVVVGKGNNSAYFKQLAKTEGIQHNVFFAGEIPQKQLLSFYSECNALVLPSINDSEGFGLVFLEAMAFSKPVIGGNAGGIPAAVEHNFNGLLVEPKNSMELTKAIKFILINKNKAKEMGLNGFKKLKDFSPEKSMNKLIGLFEGALNEKRK